MCHCLAWLLQIREAEVEELKRAMRTESKLQTEPSVEFTSLHPLMAAQLKAKQQSRAEAAAADRIALRERLMQRGRELVTLQARLRAAEKLLPQTASSNQTQPPQPHTQRAVPAKPEALSVAPLFGQASSSSAAPLASLRTSSQPLSSASPTSSHHDDDNAEEEGLLELVPSLPSLEKHDAGAVTVTLSSKHQQDSLPIVIDLSDD